MPWIIDADIRVIPADNVSLARWNAYSNGCTTPDYGCHGRSGRRRARWWCSSTAEPRQVHLPLANAVNIASRINGDQHQAPG